MRTILLLGLAAGLLGGCASQKKQLAEFDSSELLKRPAWAQDSTSKDKRFAYKTIYFEFDSPLVNEAAQEHLVAVGKYLKANKQQKVTIEGHCDERGTTEYNLALGDHRARSVTRYLKRLGIEGARLKPVSRGDLKPAVARSDEAAWAANRRVEFHK